MWKMGTFGILAPIANITPHMKNEPQTMLLAILNFFIMGSVSSFYYVHNLSYFGNTILYGVTADCTSNYQAQVVMPYRIKVGVSTMPPFK